MWWCWWVLASHGERVSQTGAWILPPSFEYHIDRNMSLGLIAFMHERRLQSVIDIGAGKGAYAAALQTAGFATDAIDGATKHRSTLGWSRAMA